MGRYVKKSGNTYWSRRFQQIFIVLLTWAFVVMPAAQYPASAAEEATSSIETGVEQYNNADYAAAVVSFTEAVKENPDNPNVYLYLGTAQMHLDNLPAAIDGFERYLALAPEGESADTVRRNLTLVKQNLAEQQAQAALSGEKTMKLGPEAEKTVAVYAFANTGDAQYDNLSRGLSAMIIHDLFQVKQFKVVERVRMQALLNEQALGGTGIVDSDTSVSTGKLLGAGKVIPGKYAATESDMKINSQLLNTLSGSMIDEQRAEGSMAGFWELEKILVFSILKDLGVEKSQILPQILDKVEYVHTKNFAAFSAYSSGLAATDLKDYAEAKKQFEKALEEDPNFELAATALAALPFAAVGTAAIISAMESAAPATSSGAVLATAAGSSTALWVTVGVVGGVAAAGGATAVAVNAASDDDDDEEDHHHSEGTTITQAGDLVGSWYVTSYTYSSSEWYMNTTLRSDGSYSTSEYYFGETATGSGSWSYSPSSRYFQMQAANGTMDGTISGTTNNFQVDGTRGGVPEQFRWVRR